jgi:outer membrane protein TolC
VEVSDTLGGNTTNAGIRQAELNRQRVQLETIQATEAITSDLANTINMLVSGSKTLAAAEARVRAENEKFNAEMKRYREGRSNTATIVQFEGDLRMAELQSALQKTTLQMATQQLKLAEGTLLTQLLGKAGVPNNAEERN